MCSLMIWVSKTVQEPVTFDDGDTLEESSSIPPDAKITLDTEEEDAEESSGGTDADFNVDEL